MLRASQERECGTLTNLVAKTNQTISGLGESKIT